MSWRLLDTGILRAAENLALNRALLEAHQAGEGVDTLRFLRFRPSALLGFHQSAEQELELEFCRQHGIEVQRRITGGGAIYFDEGQLGWELYLGRRSLGTADMGAIAQRICEAAARAISQLGVEARFRPRNDIEVAGRKISGTGGAFEGESLLYQGTLLVEFDVERMVQALKIPGAKLADKGLSSARERVTSLQELLGVVPPLAAIQQVLAAVFAAEFGVEFQPGGLNAAEQGRYTQLLAEMDCDEWVQQVARPFAEVPTGSALHRCPGGTLRAEVRIDRRRGMLKQVWITGDLFVRDRRLLPDLEAALKEVAISELGPRIEVFLAQRSADLLALTPADFTQVVMAAIQAAEAGHG